MPCRVMTAAPGLFPSEHCSDRRLAATRLPAVVHCLGEEPVRLHSLLSLRIEADSREEALENGQELFPGCRLALVNPEPGEQQH